MFQKWHRKRSFVSLDIQDDMIFLLQIHYKFGQWLIKRVDSIPLSMGIVKEGKIENPPELVLLIRQLVSKYKLQKCYVGIAIDNQHIINKSIAIPSYIEKSEYEEEINLNLEKYLPGMTDLCFDYDASKTTAESSVALVAVKQNIVNEFVDVLVKSDLVPILIDIYSYSLLRAIYFIQPSSNEITAILYVQAHFIKVMVLKKGVLIFSKKIIISPHQTSSYEDVLKSVSYLNIYDESFRLVEIKKWYLAGKIYSLPYLKNVLSQLPDLEFEILTFFPNNFLKSDLSKDLLSEFFLNTPVSLGLALRFPACLK